MMQTGTGRKLLKQLHDSPETFLIHSGSGPHGPAYQLGKDVYIEPTFHPIIQTDKGQKPATTTRILAHELGHLTGTGDDGPGRMNNINAWENPIMYPVEGFNRTSYSGSSSGTPYGSSAK